MDLDIEKAIEYATRKHEGQVRKDGSPYILHPLAVAKYLKDHGCSPETQIAGLFHDLLEDTDATEEEILELSNEKVLEAVKLLTKSDNKNCSAYIRDIRANQIAKVVKNADRIHNLTDACSGDPEFAERYAKNTKQYYVGKFSAELDLKYQELCDTFGFGEYEYIIDDSYSRENAPIYRRTKEKAWIYNRETKKWETEDPYFWLNLEDHASVISKEEAMKLLG